MVGLGEALVGNFPGRALSFTAPKGGDAAVAVRTLPSKVVAFHVENAMSLIARCACFCCAVLCCGAGAGAAPQRRFPRAARRDFPLPRAMRSVSLPYYFCD